MSVKAMGRNTINENDWVQVENYPTLITAEVARARLAFSGIGAEIFDGETANMNWLYTNALGGVKLMVKREDYDVACGILAAESEAGDVVVSEADEITPASVYCSKCHSKDVEVNAAGKAARGFSVAGVLGKWFGLKRNLQCRNCGNKWMG